MLGDASICQPPPHIDLSSFKTLKWCQKSTVINDVLPLKGQIIATESIVNVFDFSSLLLFWVKGQMLADAVGAELFFPIMICCLQSRGNICLWVWIYSTVYVWFVILTDMDFVCIV